MQFQIRYFRNPLSPAYPQQQQKGQRLWLRGMYNLKTSLQGLNPCINPAVNTRKAIHGLSYQYGFRYRKLLQDNFMNQSQKLAQWINILHQLQRVLHRIHHYPSLKALLQSPDAQAIQISGIQKYYHPRHPRAVSNARTLLARLGEGRRYNFTGRYQRFGRKKNGQLTILLTKIRYHQQLVTTHLWFNATKGFKQLGSLKPGDRLRFRARIQKYTKGYVPANFKTRYDYGLCYPTQIQKLK